MHGYLPCVCAVDLENEHPHCAAASENVQQRLPGCIGPTHCRSSARSGMLCGTKQTLYLLIVLLWSWTLRVLPQFRVCKDMTSFPTPTHTHQPGPRGGKLFEAFLAMCASDSLYSKFNRDIVRNAHHEEIDTGPYENFRSQSKLRFYSWLMMHTHTRKKLVQQRNLISFVTHFHGLTWSGLDILSRAGICSPRTTFNSWWQSAIEAQIRRTRSSLFATCYGRQRD